jgi:hypothetical protein
MCDKTKIFEDQDGNKSSFRVVWSISVIVIVFVWGWTSIATKTMQPWPLDALTTIGLFTGSAVKTFSENRK